MLKIFNKKRNNDKPNEVNNITINPPNDMGVDDVRKEISKLGLSKNVLASSENIQRIITKIYIELENREDFETYSYDTVEEINNKLNSDAEFITIGDLVLKRKSIVSIEKENNEYINSVETEKLLEEIIRRPAPTNYVSKRKVKCYIDQILKVYDYNFRDIQ
ncbi:hypothetical protein FC976_18435 [Clostridium sporogenes]|uniref:hypothetical protein n=1 Tax=Clostridium sporogenes TaxID=1509 RepID=UPI0013D0C477|nr:hypothetical protein [Clostridium sporogenes]NFH34443.1 hypothetical protein [Clostridium sporogenes]NFH49128.1 hypothetical protein [Clostridium sporogenes]NFL21810.1 hypothetical protein [Clostridium sporogenes]NFN74077.1 hypothetical protein [Clostridium sporogenes]NFV23497.1 hypothetical protein [Clostridium sporogenes]